jgi:hypothetical protein
MSELAHDLLMIEFLSWIASRPRTYSQTMEAWQSTCPRHTIWEDAVIGGFVQLSRDGGGRDPEIRLTESGLALLTGKNGHPRRQADC